MEAQRMSDEERKLDSGMAAAYRAWRENRELSPDAGISVSLSYQGDLSEIEALGFEPHGVFGDQALGIVRFKDVPVLTAHAGVLWIAAGRRRKAYLDTAVRDMRARATNPIPPGGSAVDGLWHAVIDSGALTSVAHSTGKGVIVAIMDTGIDYTHPMFISQSSPTFKSRILRIWDQGLTPTAITDCPDHNLLISAPGDTYGVEFTNAQIEAALNGGAALAHRDCDGHGTHVAGIAAGGTHFPPIVGDAKFVGVAPEADIIAVKFLDNPDKIHYLHQNGSVGDEVGEGARYRDGVMYCLRTAKALNKPIVINMSFGDDGLPGDGLDDEARFTDDVMKPGHAADDVHFPTGAIIVKAAGNEGGGGERVGRITVPASGEIVVPFILVDQRKGSNTTWQRCSQERYKPGIGVHFWYRRPAALLSVQFAVRLPFDPAPFGSDVSAGGTLQVGFRPAAGPPPTDDWVAFVADDHRLTIEHKDVPPVPHPSGGTVQRQHAHLFIEPKDAGGAISYHEGIYEVRIKAPSGTVIWAQGEELWWNDEPMVFRMNDKLRNGTDRDNTHIESLIEFSSADPLGQNAITVAAYSDQPDDFWGVPAHGIATFSSRGPLRDYSDPPRAPYCDKPEIAAPGNEITSALSRHTEGLLHWPWWYWGVRFQDLSGTSMSSPMIAGLVALMLDKNHNLDTDHVRSALTAAPRAAVEPSTPPESKNAYGAGMVDAITSHDHA